MRKILLLILILLVEHITQAVNYYISPNGDNTKDGKTKITAWQTIDKLQTEMNGSKFIAGDSILFERGGMYRGQLDIYCSGTTTAKIVFGAYGKGAKPIISGAKLINSSGWSSMGGNLWQVSYSDTIAYLFMNGKIKLLARYPNVKGFLNIDATNGVQDEASVATITCNNLNQANNYWNGARIHVRNQNDAYTISQITAFSGSVLSFFGTGFQIQKNCGFYLDNSFKMLDYEGEWFWDKAAQKLYYYSGNNPSSSIVEGSYYEYGFNIAWSKNYIHIQDLEFRYQRKISVNVSVSKGIAINNCIFRNTMNGVRTSGYISKVVNFSITNSQFFDILNTSLVLGNYTDSCLVDHNIFKRNSLIAGYEESGLITGQVIFVTGSNSRFSYNQIDSGGYCGINYGSSGHLIEKNIIKNLGLTKNDFGALQSWGSYTIKNIIRNNFCSNLIGNIEGTQWTEAGGHLYYFDNYQADNLVENNVGYDNLIGSGVFLYSVRRTTIKNNLFYNNINQIALDERPIGQFLDQPDSVYYTKDNIIKKNIAYCLDPFVQKSISFGSNWNGPTNNFAYSDSNYLYNPYTPIIAENKGKCYNLAEWQKLAGNDLLSKKHWLRIPFITSYQTDSVNKFVNATFNTNINDWVKWQSHVSLSWSSANKMSDGALRFVCNTGGTETYGDLFNNTAFKMDSGSMYLLKFRAYSAKFMGINLKITMRDAPYTDLTKSINTEYSETTPRNFNVLIKATKNETFARLHFMINAGDTLWLDDIYLYKISGYTTDDTKSRSQLFINPSDSIKTFSLNKVYIDLDSNKVVNNLVLKPWTAKVLIQTDLSAQTNISIPTDKHNEQEDFVVYPNPSNDIYYIDLNETYIGNVLISVVELSTGRLMYQKDVNKQTTCLSETLNLDFLLPGSYVLCLKMGNTVRNTILLKTSTQ